jgi:hypothetical protein
MVGNNKNKRRTFVSPEATRGKLIELKAIPTPMAAFLPFTIYARAAIVQPINVQRTGDGK